MRTASLRTRVTVVTLGLLVVVPLGSSPPSPSPTGRT